MHTTLTTPFPVMAITLSAVAAAWLLVIWWVRTRDSRSTMDGPGLLLAAAVRLLPDEHCDWGEAMTAELTQVRGPSSRWWFALGCAHVTLFPPCPSGLPVAVAGILGALATIATGLVMHRALPAMEVFAITFVGLVGAIATLTVARSRRPSLAAPGIVATSTMSLGVAGCIALFAYIAVKYPAAVHDPSHAFSVALAVLLAGYLWLALTPPRALTTSRFASGFGAAAALAYGLILGVGQVVIDAVYNSDHGDGVGIILLVAVPVGLVLACSAVAAGFGRSLRAGIETAVWAGLIIALVIFNVRLLTPLSGLLLDAIIADSDFPPGVMPNFDTWFPTLLGGELGGLITALALIPGWLLFFGLIGGSVGFATRGGLGKHEIPDAKAAREALFPPRRSELPRCFINTLMRLDPIVGRPAMNPEGRQVQPGWLWAANIGVIGYFAPFLFPNGLTGVKEAGPYIVYFFSIPVVFLVLAAVGISGGVGLLRSRIREQPLKPRHRAFLLIGCVGVALFALAISPAGNLPRPMATGSHPQRFDRASWQAPRAAEYTPRDVTPRQKMVSDVVENVLPGHTRAELAGLLGPSEKSPFIGTGHDFAYKLGPVPDYLFLADSDWLLIWLDENGRFRRHAIVGD